MLTTLDRYRPHLDKWTFEGQVWPAGAPQPRSRYDTFRRAFELLMAAGGRVVIELGTTRSYTHGGLPSCNTDDVSSWSPDAPEHWDWGAGCFSRLAAECLFEVAPTIHTVDISRRHIRRARRITREFRSVMQYHVRDSRKFLARFRGTADLIYLDTGDMTPIEPTARLQLEEAQIIVARRLLAPRGLLLLDDVRNPAPRADGETSGLGKSKYALPYLLAHGFRIDMDEYQVLLVRAEPP